eukprot:GILJ01006040.1.p1 GENE.GILJ01006040.1~~GILJ01006040.1.p1  ORF type:complete len:340 (-),score=48.41 GILJ01006040.1:277-1296(-)
MGVFGRAAFLCASVISIAAITCLTQGQHANLCDTDTSSSSACSFAVGQITQLLVRFQYDMTVLNVFRAIPVASLYYIGLLQGFFVAALFVSLAKRQDTDTATVCEAVSSPSAVLEVVQANSMTISPVKESKQSDLCIASPSQTEEAVGEKFQSAEPSQTDCVPCPVASTKSEVQDSIATTHTTTGKTRIPRRRRTDIGTNDTVTRELRVKPSRKSLHVSKAKEYSIDEFETMKVDKKKPLSPATKENQIQQVSASPVALKAELFSVQVTLTPDRLKADREQTKAAIRQRKSDMSLMQQVHQQQQQLNNNRVVSSTVESAADQMRRRSLRVVRPAARFMP